MAEHLVMEAAAKEAEVQELNEPEVQELPEKEYQRELHLINQIATITAHTLDLQEITNKVLGEVLEFCRIDAGLLLLWDRVRQRLTFAASKGISTEYLKQISQGKLETVIGPHLAAATQPLIIKDTRNDKRLLTSTFAELIQHDPRFRSLVSIPLTYRDSVTGFLNLASTSPKPFHSSRKFFFSTLGNQIGLAMENARLYH